MKRFVLRAVVLVFALCSIGGKECTPGTGASSQNSGLPFCHSDPPIFCAAYCSGYDSVTFRDECSDIGADTLEILFELKVMSLYQEQLNQDIHLCTQADPFTFLTPCQIGIIPQEWPNQDHEVCQPVPPGCPM
ncbi:hypothetical protein ACSRUE_16715 [Sorangium sp. KYC3313]|uniref:hypothetical protein n=1 Tax=Sorangium sp. KYC3313 TaxID=3449740 RepID=UPI003F8A4433